MALNFIKSYYKEIIAICFAILIGNSIGGTGKVSTTEVDSMKAEIKVVSTALETKIKELEKLEIEHSELKQYINN